MFVYNLKINLIHNSKPINIQIRTLDIQQMYKNDVILNKQK